MIPMKTRARIWSLCFLATALPCNGSAADPAASGKPLELAQIFGPAAIPLERTPVIRWLAEGVACTTLEKSANAADSMDVVRYETAQPRQRVSTVITF